MVRPIVNPVEYEEPYWEPIGQFVIRFGYLEKTIDTSITGLLELHTRQGEAVASQILNLRSRIRLIEKLCYLVTADTEHRKAVTEIVEEIVKLNTYRNGLLHGQWGSYHMSGNEESYWSKLDVNPQNFKYREFQVRLSELTTNLKRITAADVRLSNFIQQVLNDHHQSSEQPPSPDTPS